MMGGFFPGLPPTKQVIPDEPPTVEKLVQGAQEIAQQWLAGNSDLVNRATYYRLYALDYRIPTDPHGDLRRAAKKYRDAL